MKRKAVMLITAVCAAAMLSAPSYAQGVADSAGELIEDAGNGVARAAEGIGNGAARAVEGAGSAVDDVLDGNRRDQDYGKNENDVIIAEDDTDIEDYDIPGRDVNPATGIPPLVPAGLVAVSAAGVAYLTKKRNRENGQMSEK